MRRREMMKLFTTEYRKDPATGKEKRVSRYIGSWYTLEKTQRRKATIMCAAAWLVCTAAFVAAGLIPARAGLCNYVVPWYIVCLLPLFYLLLGTVKLARLKDKFTAMDEAESLGYIRASGLGLTGLGAAWSAATVVFLFLTDISMTLPRELIYLGCGAVTAVMGLAAFLAARRLPLGLIVEDGASSGNDGAQEA